MAPYKNVSSIYKEKFKKTTVAFKIILVLTPCVGWKKTFKFSHDLDIAFSSNGMP